MSEETFVVAACLPDPAIPSVQACCRMLLRHGGTGVKALGPVPPITP